MASKNQYGASEENSMKKDKIYYFFDALCSWCYGFSPVVQKLHEKHGNEIDFSIISGGMVTGDRVGPVGEHKDFLRNAYAQVSERTGAEFGKPFTDALEEGSMIFSSVEPSRALASAKSLRPEIQLAFAAEIQNAVYRDGKAPTDYETYIPIAESFNIPSDAFRKQLEAEQPLESEDFYTTQQFGIESYPSVVMEHDGQLFLIAKGYTEFERLDKIIYRVVNNLPAGA